MQQSQKQQILNIINECTMNDLNLSTSSIEHNRSVYILEKVMSRIEKEVK